MAGGVRMPLPEWTLSDEQALELPLGSARPALVDSAGAAMH